MTDPRVQQYQFEIDSDTEAAAAKLEQLRAAAQGGDVTLPKAQRFLSRAYASVKEHLDKEVADKARGRAAKYKNWLRAIPTSVMAVLALRECIAQLSLGKVRDRPVTIQLLAGSIGRLYEVEVRISEAEQVNPLYMQRMHQQVKDRATTNTKHLQKVYDFAYAQVMKEYADHKLNAVEIIQLGKFGVQACLDAGIIQLKKTFGKSGRLHFYELTEEVQEYLTDYQNRDVQNIMQKEAGAMTCPPDPWETLSGGGYLSPRRKMNAPLMSLKGIRRSERKRLREEFTAEKMPVVFDCANYLQSIPMQVHQPTLDAIRRLWNDGGGVLGVPRRNPPAKPESPMAPEWTKTVGTEEELEQFTAWKRLASKWHTDLREWRGKVRELGGFLRTSQRTDGALWFPVFMDTRGRWYYRGTPNPQGSDLSKAVLHFHEKKPLGHRGIYWLKVAIANHYGYDKVRFDERVAWTDANWPKIVSALDSPEDYPDVWGTDAPWCMFSAAYELREALRQDDPASYVCGVPIHMDATCSGLQHFSALLRDPVGGRYVNLYDEDFCGPKQDIYGQVATNTLKVCMRDSQSSDEELAAYAAFWLKAGIPRNMAKKPVMTYCYGATLRGTTEFVQGFAEDEIGVEWPESMSPYKASMYMARKLFQGISSTVPAAEACMQWLKNTAKAVPRGTRMEWPAPTGFLVQHDYQGYDEIDVRLRSCGVHQAVVREFNDDTLPTQMQNAIAPNFVHNLDASHLTFTALSMRDAGCSMVAIHDSFGTHPSDVDTMHRLIREQFVQLYQSRNILGEFLWAVQAVGEVPMQGTLDLTRVLDSEFFFC